MNPKPFLLSNHLTLPQLAIYVSPEAVHASHPKNSDFTAHTKDVPGFLQKGNHRTNYDDYTQSPGTRATGKFTYLDLFVHFCCRSSRSPNRAAGCQNHEASSGKNVIRTASRGSTPVETAPQRLRFQPALSTLRSHQNLTGSHIEFHTYSALFRDCCANGNPP